jgi:hypothetical protein
MKLKVGLCTIVLVLATAGVAEATGVFKHSDPEMNSVQQKQESLEGQLEESGAQGLSADALSRGARGPRGRRGARGPQGQRGPQGPTGPKGATGATGPTGATGTFGSITSVSSVPAYLCSWEAGACAVGSTRAECPPGTTLVGGGYSGAGIVTTVTYNAPSGNGWGIVAVNFDEVPVTNLRAVAQCATH